MLLALFIAALIPVRLCALPVFTCCFDASAWMECVVVIHKNVLNTVSVDGQLDKTTEFLPRRRPLDSHAKILLVPTKETRALLSWKSYPQNFRSPVKNRRGRTGDSTSRPCCSSECKEKCDLGPAPHKQGGTPNVLGRARDLKCTGEEKQRASHRERQATCTAPAADPDLQTTHESALVRSNQTERCRTGAPKLKILGPG